MSKKLNTLILVAGISLITYGIYSDFQSLERDFEEFNYNQVIFERKLDAMNREKITSIPNAYSSFGNGSWYSASNYTYFYNTSWSSPSTYNWSITLEEGDILSTGGTFSIGGH